MNNHVKNLSGAQTYNVINTKDEWTLYHNNFSLCSRKVRTCFEELDIQYVSKHIEIIETGFAENITNDFLKINPLGTVPVLLHHGKPIYESHEQIKYLCQHSKSLGSNDEKVNYWITKSSLIGDPTQEIERYAGNCAALLTPPLFIAMLKNISYSKFINYCIKHPIKQRPALFLMLKIFGFQNIKKGSVACKLVNKGFKNMNKHLNEMEQHLSENNYKWIAGNQFSLADISWMPLLHRLEETLWLELLLKNKPKVQSYYSELKNRKSFQKAINDLNQQSVNIGINILKNEINKKSSPLKLLHDQIKSEFLLS